ncbi:MAG: hypothetical protein ABI083_20660, partial [Lapillicoccus sp.]
MRSTRDARPPLRSLGRRTARRALVTALLTGLLATLLGATSVLVGPTSARASEIYPLGANGLVTVSGRGFGHGHGMSQWGAYGAASQGIGWQQIVDHYYPGTVRTPIGNPTIRVDVRGD